VETEVPVSVNSINQHESEVDIIDLRSDSEDNDFDDCSYSTDDYHWSNDVDMHDMSNCTSESVESISGENLIVNAAPSTFTATAFSSTLEGPSTSCAPLDLSTCTTSSAYVDDLTTAEGGDNIDHDFDLTENTRPEDGNEDSSLSSTHSAAECTLSITDGAPSTGESANTTASEENLALDNGIAECDIGKLLHDGVNLRMLSRENKYIILKHKPNPSPSVYPRTRCHGSATYRQFQPKWINQYSWLHYSPHVDGVFCTACVFFAPDKVGGQTPGQFVSSPFKMWVVQSQKMLAHAKLGYHLTAMARMQEYLTRYAHPATAIDVASNRKVQQNMENNVNVLESLFKIVLLCGKQGIALRGHRDDKINWFEQDEDDCNHGNFNEIVRFRAETDETLRKHLQNAPRNAKYTSKTIQNDMIQVIGKHIRKSILNEVQKAKYYSVIADEVADIGNKEQLSISIRYNLDNCVKEVFLDYVQLDRITGREIADAILSKLESWELNVDDLRGQCYDGGSNMSGAKSGCRALVQERAPLALYTHCAAHQLNLAIVAACKIQAFKNTESCIGEIARFFQSSPKRQHLLDKVMENVSPAPKSKKLKDACRTRWIQRIDSYVVFLELLPSVHIALQAISDPEQFEYLGTNWNWDSETITKANGFLYQLESSLFLITFEILLEVLSSLRGLTMKLQMQSVDVLYAHKEVKNVITSLGKMRESSEREFRQVFASATKLGKDLHGSAFTLTKPRLTGRQIYRHNVVTSTAEEYYRISFYNDFLSHVVAELKERFISNPLNGVGLLHLLPCECCKSKDKDDETPEDLRRTAEFYANDLPHSAIFPVEYRMWSRMWQDKEEEGTELPKKLIDVLQACDSMTFPNIHVLLRLALTLPITSCESERSFSQLKLVKTARRSTMTTSRLGDLTLMKINRNYSDQLHIKDLVQTFSQMHSRRMKLPFILND